MTDRTNALHVTLTAAPDATEFVHTAIQNAFSDVVRDVDFVDGLDVFAVEMALLPGGMALATLAENLRTEGLLLWRFDVLALSDGFMLLFKVARFSDESF